MDESNLQNLIQVNKDQLSERVKPDECLVHRHWASERALVSFIPPSAKMMLDLGCGPTGGLLMHVPDMDYVGLDFVHEYLADLRRGHSEIGPWEFSHRWWIQSLMEVLPFPDRSFDVVYSRHALEHSTNLKATLSEIKRVLKPGGIFIFCVPARVDDTEPAHITRWPARKWLAAFRTVGKIRFYAQHDYFIDELYGYAQKPGWVTPSLIHRARQWIKYLRGQGLIPNSAMNVLIRADQVVQRLFAEQSRTIH